MDYDAILRGQAPKLRLTIVNLETPIPLVVRDHRANRELVRLTPDGQIIFPDDLTLDEAKTVIENLIREVMQHDER